MIPNAFLLLNMTLLVLLTGCGTEFGNGFRKESPNVDPQANNAPDADPTTGDRLEEAPEAEEDKVETAVASVLANSCFSPIAAGALGTYQYDETTVVISLDDDVYTVTITGDSELTFRVETNTSTDDAYDITPIGYTTPYTECTTPVLDDEGYLTSTVGTDDEQTVVRVPQNGSTPLADFYLGDERYQLVP
ncbi:MAG: hypothetical protein HRU19_17385 [Pseudobacteriovorax sp.]|nr:hypothetical protein [Pseudobacteriovorax sp.]